MTTSKKIQRNARVRFIDKWHELLAKDEGYAEAFFVGGWTFATDEEAADILMNLDRDDFAFVMDYPIFS